MWESCSFAVFVCLHHDGCTLSLLFCPREINPTQNSSWWLFLLVNTFRSDLDKLPLLKFSIEHYLVSFWAIAGRHTQTCFSWQTLSKWSYVKLNHLKMIYSTNIQCKWLNSRFMWFGPSCAYDEKHGISANVGFSSIEASWRTFGCRSKEQSSQASLEPTTFHWVEIQDTIRPQRTLNSKRFTSHRS